MLTRSHKVHFIFSENWNNAYGSGGGDSPRGRALSESERGRLNRLLERSQRLTLTFSFHCYGNITKADSKIWKLEAGTNPVGVGVGLVSPPEDPLVTFGISVLHRFLVLKASRQSVALPAPGAGCELGGVETLKEPLHPASVTAGQQTVGSVAHSVRCCGGGHWAAAA